MVGAINAPATGNTFESFQSNAKGLPSASILQPTPALVGNGASATSLFAASDASASASATTSGTSTAATSTNTGSGAGAVGVNGVVAVVAAAFGVALL